MKNLRLLLSAACLTFLTITGAFAVPVPAITPVIYRQSVVVPINIVPSQISMINMTVHLTGIAMPVINISAPVAGTISISVVHPWTVQLVRITPTIVGSNVKIEDLKGMRFDDVYVANPDYQYDAKSYASLSEKDLARFDIHGAAKSQLEAQLFPQMAEKETVASQEPYSFPVTMFSVDQGLQIEG